MSTYRTSAMQLMDLREELFAFTSKIHRSVLCVLSHAQNSCRYLEPIEMQCLQILNWARLFAMHVKN